MTRSVRSNKRLSIKGEKDLKIRLSVDAALRNTGYALWCNKQNEPIVVGSFKCNASIESPEYYKKAMSVFISSLGFGNIQEIAVEWPSVWLSGKGLTAATRGDVNSTCFAACAWLHIAHSNNISVRTIPVNDWKGDLPKDVVQARLSKILDDKWLIGSKGWDKNDHQVDAVGIGMYAFRNEK